MERTTQKSAYSFFWYYIRVNAMRCETCGIYIYSAVRPHARQHFEGHYAPKQRQRCVTYENCEAIYRIVYFKN